MNRLLTKYNRLEDNNDHTEAAKLLVSNFGTKEELEIIEGIEVRQNRNGYVTHEDIKLRFEVSNKYFCLLRNLK